MNAINEASHEKTNGDTENQDDRIFPVLFMFISLVNLIFCLGFVFFIELKISFIMVLFSYVTIVFLEYKNNIKSPVSIFMLVMYIILAVLSWADIYIGHRTGVIIFSSLALIVGGLLLFGKPFTQFYSSGRGIKSLHYVNSIVWFISYLFSIFCSTWFLPEIEFILYPYLICVSAGLITIFFSLVWFGVNNVRENTFRINDFVFKRIENEIEGYREFFIEKVLSDKNREHLSIDSLSNEILGSTIDEGKNTFIFCAYDNNKIVGSIRCILANRSPLPIEDEARFNLHELNELGKIIQAGRFSIDEDYRERPEVMIGLFKCLIELALEKDVSFIIGNAAIHRVTLYMRLGFSLLFSVKDPRSRIKLTYGTVCTPVILNFSNLIIKNRSQANKYGFIEYVNRYLLERWYKRAVIRYYFKGYKRRPWELEVKDIRILVTSPGDTCK